jgi:CRP-like cAMP-binding protein
VSSSTPLGENRLLQRANAADLARLKPDLKKVRMILGEALHPAGAPIEQIYFPLGGMVSLLTVMKSGEQIETAIIGREGVVGAAIGIDGALSNVQATVQLNGSAWQITAPRFLEVYKSSEHFRLLMNHSLAIIHFQAQQSAACHALHTVESRLCRWLLHAQDTVGGDTVDLTQEFLSHMLGVQRSSVSQCAHALQRTGTIQYTRGRIRIVDRAGLEECACECYGAICEYIDKVLPPR